MESDRTERIGRYQEHANRFEVPGRAAAWGGWPAGDSGPELILIHRSVRMVCVRERPSSRAEGRLCLGRWRRQVHKQLADVLVTPEPLANLLECPPFPRHLSGVGLGGRSGVELRLLLRRQSGPIGVDGLPFGFSASDFRPLTTAIFGGLSLAGPHSRLAGLALGFGDIALGRRI